MATESDGLGERLRVYERRGQRLRLLKVGGWVAVRVKVRVKVRVDGWGEGLWVRG